MARTTKQSPNSNDRVVSEKVINLGKFTLSTKPCWGTSLEKKLVQLPYLELAEAFRKAAEVIKVSFNDLSVVDVVRMTKPRKIESTRLADPWSEDFIYTRLLNARTSEVKDQIHIPALGLLLASIVIRRLWVLSELLGQNGERISTHTIVTAVTEVCLLAERARQVFYTEERTIQWNKLNRSKKSLVAVSTAGRPRNDLLAVLHDAIRWMKKNSSRFPNITEACTAYLDCNLHSIPSLLLYASFHRGAETIDLSAPVCMTQGVSERADLRQRRTHNIKEA